MKFLGIHIGYKTQNRILFILCLTLLLLFIYLSFIRKRISPPNNQEGFSQDQNFLVKRDQEIFDDFLAEIYDRIYQPASYNHYIFDAIEQATQPSKTKSVLLDAGCGTGELLGYMAKKKGYKYVYGLDMSPDMVDYCQDKWDDAVRVKQGNFLVPMTYDKGTFTHIFMTGDTIYHVQDKLTMLYNLHSWLMPNGYLILQLNDPARFNPIPMSGRPVLVDSVQDYTSERITNSNIDFPDFIFKSILGAFGAAAGGAGTEAVYQETFVDKATNHVRQNETVLYMNPIEEIIQMCQYVGFLVHGQFDMRESAMKDPYQYVFVLERI